MTYRDNPHDEHCKRNGCSRRRTGRNLERDCCSGVCLFVYQRHQESQAICEYLGHSEPVDEYMVSTLEAGKAIDRVNRARSALRKFASDAGWTTTDFDDLAAGRYRQRGTGQVQEVAG
jgi:hypothetical protein